MNRQQRRAAERAKKRGPVPSEAVGKGVRICVCVPALTEVKAFFSYDLAQMMAFTSSHYCKPGVIENLGLAYQVGTYVHRARQELAAEALRQDADYILFVDSDMRFPPDALIQLLVHQEAMVGVNYVARGYPPRYIAVKTLTAKDSTEKGTLLKTLPDSTGLEEVDGFGFGLVLIRRDVFEALPDPREQPWWWYEWMPVKKSQIGEDVYFCRLAVEAGFTLYVDHDLSKQVAHIGHEVFTLEHAWAYEMTKREKADGPGNELLDSPDGDSGHPEPDGSDGDDPGVHPEGGSGFEEKRSSEAAGRLDPVRGDD